jgi:hypothetical protein
MTRVVLHRLLMLAVLLIISMTFSVGAGAATVPITSYDVAQTPASGFGCWTHNFTGTITDTGHTVSGSVICAGGGHVLNYSNGSGTLNDGVFDTTHLLLTRTDDQGQPLQPVITLHLEGMHAINEIRLLKGNMSFTNITGATLRIGGTELNLIATPIGGDPLSVLLDLRGTALAAILTNQVILKNFTASWGGGPIDQFGIGEVVVDGAEVVEPTHTVPITSYDVAQTPASGFGCWTHNFTGTITDTGHTVSGSVICAGGGHVLNYSNGSGTLNDGVFDTTHLLLTRTDDQGQPLQPVITLHLEGMHTIKEVRLLKGNMSFTNITGATVRIGKTELNLIATPIGGDPLSVRLNLRGTTLAAIPTNQVTLKGFTASWGGGPIDQFGIGEVVVDGTDVVPPTKNVSGSIYLLLGD